MPLHSLDEFTHIRTLRTHLEQTLTECHTDTAELVENNAYATCASDTQIIAGTCA